jgi:hypothetical protein
MKVADRDTHDSDATSDSSFEQHSEPFKNRFSSMQLTSWGSSNSGI